jgi:hypothetical protein
VGERSDSIFQKGPILVKGASLVRLGHEVDGGSRMCFSLDMESEIPYDKEISIISTD